MSKYAKMSHDDCIKNDVPSPSDTGKTHMYFWMQKYREAKGWPLGKYSVRELTCKQFKNQLKTHPLSYFEIPKDYMGGIRSPIYNKINCAIRFYGYKLESGVQKTYNYRLVYQYLYDNDDDDDDSETESDDEWMQRSKPIIQPIEQPIIQKIPSIEQPIIQKIEQPIEQPIIQKIEQPIIQKIPPIIQKIPPIEQPIIQKISPIAQHSTSVSILPPISTIFALAPPLKRQRTLSPQNNYNVTAQQDVKYEVSEQIKVLLNAYKVLRNLHNRQLGITQCIIQGCSYKRRANNYYCICEKHSKIFSPRIINIICNLNVPKKTINEIILILRTILTSSYSDKKKN